MSTPLISVIIPVYNGDKYLRDAINSVLAQIYSNIEIIIINDGSIDGSAQICLEYKDKIKYVEQPNQGVAAARNTGIAIAKGEYITFLDQDDWYPTDRCEIMMNALKASKTEVVMGHTQFIFETEQSRQRWQHIPDDGVIFTPLMGASLYKRDLFDKIGTLVDELDKADDIELYYRLKRHKIEIQKINNICLFYRQYDSNTSAQATNVAPPILKSIKHIINSKRKNG